MRTRFVTPFMIAVLVVLAFVAQPSVRVLAVSNADASQRAIEGLWRLQQDGLPSVTLNISYESGSLNGAILFYLLRKEPGKAETSTAGIPEPLIDPKFDGTTLTFAVSHRRAHPPDSLNTPPVTFALTVTGPNKAKLIRGKDGSHGMEMVKDAD